MNRTPKELIKALKFAILDRSVAGFLIGDNEAARLIEEIERLWANEAARAALTKQEERG